MAMESVMLSLGTPAPPFALRDVVSQLLPSELLALHQPRST